MACAVPSVAIVAVVTASTGRRLLQTKRAAWHGLWQGGAGGGRLDGLVGRLMGAMRRP
jgi:hypothetical protein